MTCSAAEKKNKNCHWHACFENEICHSKHRKSTRWPHQALHPGYRVGIMISYTRCCRSEKLSWSLCRHINRSLSMATVVLPNNWWLEKLSSLRGRVSYQLQMFRKVLLTASGALHWFYDPCAHFLFCCHFVSFYSGPFLCNTHWPGHLDQCTRWSSCGVGYVLCCSASLGWFSSSEVKLRLEHFIALHNQKINLVMWGRQSLAVIGLVRARI